LVGCEVRKGNRVSKLVSGQCPTQYSGTVGGEGQGQHNDDLMSVCAWWSGETNSNKVKNEGTVSKSLRGGGKVSQFEANLPSCDGNKNVTKQTPDGADVLGAQHITDYPEDKVCPKRHSSMGLVKKEANKEEGHPESHM